MDNRIRIVQVWSDGKCPPPALMDISLTDTCNLRCRSCWLRNPKFEGLDSRQYELSEIQVKSLIKEALDFGIGSFEITGGGEPLMRMELALEVMRIIKSNAGNADYGSMTTNGTLFDREFAEEMVEIGWDQVVFSVDGINEEMQDYLRGQNGVFKSVIRNLMLFNEIKKQKRKKKPQISFNTVLSNRNYRHVADFIGLAHETGVSTVNFEPLTVHSELGLGLKLNEEQIREMQGLIPLSEQTAERHNIITNISNFMEDSLIRKKNQLDVVYMRERVDDERVILCYEPWYHLVVKVDGAAGPCCVFGNSPENVKEKSLREIWFGKFFNSIRESIKEKRLMEWCRTCNAGQLIQNRKMRQRVKC